MSPGTITALPQLGLKDRKSRKIGAIIGISRSSLSVPEEKMPGAALRFTGWGGSRAQPGVKTPRASFEHQQIHWWIPGLSSQTAKMLPNPGSATCKKPCWAVKIQFFPVFFLLLFASLTIYPSWSFPHLCRWRFSQTLMKILLPHLWICAGVLHLPKSLLFSSSYRQAHPISWFVFFRHF